MKALSVKSPHAQRIALGQKTLEIRSKRTHYRGDLLICVSQRPAAGEHRIAIPSFTCPRCKLTHHRGPLNGADCYRCLRCGETYLGTDIRIAKENVCGMGICVVELWGCRSMLPGDAADACHDYVPDHFVWKLRNARLIKPFPVKGQLSMFDVDDARIHYRRALEDRLSDSLDRVPPRPVHESRSSFALQFALTGGEV